jgi:gliding motility-associated-like protein
VTIIVNPPLSVVVGNPQATCPGGSVTITATAAGGDGVYTYTWQPGNEVGQTVTVVPTATGYYTVTVNDNCGTPVAIDSVLVTVDPLPKVSFTADSMSGCSPLCVTFKDLTTITSGGLKSWSWNFGDSNTSTSENPHHCYPNSGSYTVSLTVTSDSGCNSILTVPKMITVYSHPVAAFELGPQPAYVTNPTINFTDQSTDAYGLAAWSWSFGDPADGTSNKQNPTYTYADTGNYCATLVVTNIHGCTDSITHCLVISPEFTIYIPNAFTPNGDGLNDVFQPKGEFVKNYNMYIFDRWGMMIFHTDDFNKGWNGCVNGGTRICQEDTYVYVIEVTDGTGKQHKYIGKVTLLQ